MFPVGGWFLLLPSSWYAMRKTLPELRELTLSDRRKVTDWLRRFPPEVSELTFTNLYVWRRMREVRMAEFNGALLFVCEEEGKQRLLGPPVGDVAPGDLPELLGDLGVTEAERLGKTAAEALRRAGVKVAEDRDQYDYVYLREELAALDGRRLHRKKNMVNRCLANYPCEYVEIDRGNVDEVLEMQARWGRSRDCKEDPALCAENLAIRDSLAHFDEFGLVGGAVRIDGQIEAFTLGEALNEETAVVHFEKAMTQFQGLYQLINCWFCEHTLGGFTFVNREQDLGIPGLRKAKKSYLPHHMVEKFVACWDEGPCACHAQLHGRCAEHGVDDGDHA